MSYLFSGRRSRPFSQSKGSGSESDDVAWESQSSKAKRHKREELLSKSQVTCFENISQNPSHDMPTSRLEKEAVVFVSDSPPNFSLNASTVTSPSRIPESQLTQELSDDFDAADDPVLKSARCLLSKLQESKSKFGDRVTSSSSSSERNDHGPKEQQKEQFNYMPNIRSAAQRLQLAASQLKVKDKNFTAESTEPAEAMGSPSVCVIIKVRLAGKQDVRHNMKIDEEFSSLMRMLAEVQGISVNDFSLIFDGEKIFPESTPESLDMDAGEEFLVDVVMKKKR